jgi:hypothetical protein
MRLLPSRWLTALSPTRGYHNDMDSTLSTAELASRLGSSVPRVHRAVAAGLIDPIPSNGGRALRFSTAAVDQLRAVWGYAPVVPGLTREQVLVLAVLARRPLGVRSARVVARAAGISPTTAGTALRHLEEAGYVTHTTVRTVEGRVVDLPVWSIGWRSERWWEVASLVEAAILPAHPSRPSRRPRKVPSRLWHLFWDTDPSTLDPDGHGVYIADRILRSTDNEALAWLATAVSPEALRSAARRRGLSRGQRRLALTLANAWR